MSFEVEYKKSQGKAVQAALHCLELAAIQRTALQEHGQPPCSPAEQLALLRAQKGAKRPGGRHVCFAWSGLKSLPLHGRKKTPMQAIETKRLNEGWWKEIRVRQSGKQKGSVFACYTNTSGAVYYSRTKAEAAGCCDPEPDRRTLRHKDAANSKKPTKATVERKPKAKATKKPKAKAKRKTTKRKDPESAQHED